MSTVHDAEKGPHDATRNSLDRDEVGDEQGHDHDQTPDEAAVTSAETAPLAEPFSVWSLREKMVIVLMSSLAGLLSPLTAIIYLPAIPVMAQQFHKSTELINLTVTTYMIGQGVAPMVFGPMSDRKGRRPAFIVCMIILCGTCIGLALTPTSAYWLLVLLRFIQAAGSASTIAIGAGVVADVVTSDQRGSFIGIVLIGPTVGPCIGPIIGGVLAEHLGWRSIFWFLTISAAVICSFLVLFYPETLRLLVGNGSIRPRWYGRPLVPLLAHYSLSQPTTKSAARPGNPFLIFKNFDIVIVLAGNAVTNSIFYAVAATQSSLFHEAYPSLSETSIGLTYISIGVGMFVGSLAAGRLMDWQYRRADGPKGRGKELPLDFPIEKVRLGLSPIYVGMLCVSCVGYGWAVQKRVHLSVPLILHFIIGYAAIGLLNIQQTLLLDLLTGQGASITAANNLVRCVTAAALVSFVDIIIRGIGVGWTFVLLGLVSAVLLGLILWGATHVGPRWRRKRAKVAT